VKTVVAPHKRGNISMNPGDFLSDGNWSASQPNGEGLFQDTQGTFKVQNGVATLKGPQGQVIELKEYDPAPGHAGDATLYPIGDDPAPIRLIWSERPL